MAHQLTEYLKELPQSTVVQLFSMRHAVLVVYRLLCPLSQYLIRRLMFVDGGTPFDHLRTWQINECRGKQSVALLDLKRLYILEGKSGCVWLNATFRSSLIDAFNLGVYTDLKPCVKCVVCFFDHFVSKSLYRVNPRGTSRREWTTTGGR